MGFFYYNNNLYNINLGVYIPDKNNTNSQIFMENLKQSQLNIFESSSITDCENDIKNGLVHACIFLPEDFKITENKNNTITVKLDASRGDIVSITENLLINQLSTASKKIQISYTQELIDTINYSENKINQNNQKIIQLNQINNEIKTQTKNIEVIMAQLALTFSIETLDISNIDDRITRANSTIVEFVDKTLPMLNISVNSMTNLSTIINSELNSSSTKTELQKLIKIINANLDIAKGRTESLQDTYHLKKLFEETNELETNLYKIKENMDKLTANIDTLITNQKNNTNQIKLITKDIETNNNDILIKINNLYVKDASSITNPTQINIQNIIANSKTHLTSLFPALIISLVSIISIILSSTFILSERKSQAHFRNVMTKNSAFNFLLSDFLTLLLIVFLQIITIVIIYYTLFLKTFNTNVLFLAIALIPIIGIFILLGMINGYLTSNESTNVITSFFIIFILLAFSGQLLPLEIIPKYIVEIITYNPYLISESIIRKLLLFDTSFLNLKLELILIISYISILFLTNYILESISKKRFLYQIYVSSNLSIKEKITKLKSNRKIKK